MCVSSCNPVLRSTDRFRGCRKYPNCELSCGCDNGSDWLFDNHGLNLEDLPENHWQNSSICSDFNFEVTSAPIKNHIKIYG